MKKLIPAIVMLLVSAVVLSTASYAWFTTSRQVEADGMQVTAQAPTSILIRGMADNATWTAYSNNLNFTDIYQNTKLTPVSSANGVNFFAPGNAYDTAGAMDYMTDIDEVTGTAGYYVDYRIELKNDSAVNEVDLTVANIADAVKSAMSNAIRVAFIVGTPGAAADNNTAAPVAGSTNTTVYTTKDYAKNWVNVASKDANGNLEYKTAATGPIKEELEVIATTEDVTGTTYAEWAAVATGTAADASPYKTFKAENLVTLKPQECVQIVIRVWFEGQDGTCISANAGAKANLSVQFEIKAEREYVAPVESDTQG